MVHRERRPDAPVERAVLRPPTMRRITGFDLHRRDHPHETDDHIEIDLDATALDLDAIEIDLETTLDPDTIEIDLDTVAGTGVLGWVDRLLKRAVDVVCSATALALAAPLFLAIWVAIRTTSTGPAIFRHRRIGEAGAYFDCLKFRTMHQDADRLLDNMLADNEQLREEHSRTHKLRDDPRVTPIGVWLRKTSLDELPQFWNVLKGEMSIVGPRPIVDEEVARYGRWLPVVLRCRPGITGLWQVSGRNDTTYAERIALDRRYALNRSIVADVSIMLRTPVIMVKRNGAY